MHRIGMMTEFINYYKNTEGALKVIKDIGFECADLTLFSPSSVTELNEDIFSNDYVKRAEEIKEYAKSIDLALVQSHAIFPTQIKGNDEYNMKAIPKLIDSIKFCGLVGIPYIVVHPCNDYTAEENLEFFNKLLPTAEEYGVVIATENMWNGNPGGLHVKKAACSHPEDFNKHVDIANSPYLKACLDVGHAQMFLFDNVTPHEFIESLGDRLVCLHLHDNDSYHDLHALPFSGSIDWTKLVNSLKKINYQGDLISEVAMDVTISFDEALKQFKDRYNALIKIRDLF